MMTLRVTSKLILTFFFLPLKEFEGWDILSSNWLFFLGFAIYGGLIAVFSEMDWNEYDIYVIVI